MTGDCATCVCTRYARFLAQGWNQCVIQVSTRKLVGAVDKKEMNEFTRLRVQQYRLFRTDLFPSFDLSPNDGINGLHKRRTRLVDRHMQKAGSHGRDVLVLLEIFPPD